MHSLILPAIIGGGNGGGGSLLVYDTFTDTDGTILTAHTPDIDSVGGGWSNETGSQTINNNSCEEDDYTVQSLSIIDAGSADVVITANCRIWHQGGGTANATAGVCFRYTDVNNYWIAILGTFSTNPWRWDLYEVNGGSFISRGTDVGITGSFAIRELEFIVTLDGQNVRFEIPEEGVDISYNNATYNQTATEHGTRLYRNATAAVPAIMSDIKMELAP